MNDLEELLRTDLARAAEPIDSGLDADGLLATGQRARRSRAMRVGAGLTAVLVTVAGLGLAVAATVANGGRAPVLATPSPAPSVSVTPSATPSASMIYESHLPAKASFDVKGLGINKTDAPFDRLVVAADVTSAGMTSITVTGSKPGQADQKASALLEAGRTSAAFIALGKRLVVSIVPGTASRADLFAPPGSGIRASDIQPLAAVGMTAHVTVFEHGLADPTKGAGIIWQTPDGSLYSTSGAEVPSAEVSVAGERARVYRSEEIGELGMWGDGSKLGGTSMAIKDSTPSSLIGGGMGRCGDVPPTGCTWTNFVALPPGTTKLQLTLNPNAPDSGWTSATLSDGWVMVVAVNHSSKETSTVVDSADYVDASGKAVHLGK